MDLQLVICKYQYKCIIYFSFLRKINTVFPSRIPLSLPLSLSLSLSISVTVLRHLAIYSEILFVRVLSSTSFGRTT